MTEEVQDSPKVKSVFDMLFTDTMKMATEAFKIRLMLKQNEAEFYAMIRRDFAKRLRISFFDDDGSGELNYELKYKHWYLIPYYFFFRDRRRILSETAIIVAEEYLFKLTGRQVRKGHTDFLSTGK